LIPKSIAFMIDYGPTQIDSIV